MSREYSKEEKQSILRDLDIVLLNNMLSAGQAAQVLSRRAEIEVGQTHTYKEDTIRQHVKSKRLEVAQKVHDRMNLFKVDDVFALSLSATRWRAGQPKKGKGRRFTKTRPKSIDITT